MKLVNFIGDVYYKAVGNEIVSISRDGKVQILMKELEQYVSPAHITDLREGIQVWESVCEEYKRI